MESCDVIGEAKRKSITATPRRAAICATRALHSASTIARIDPGRGGPPPRITRKAARYTLSTVWYDNTKANPNNPDPDQWVGYGDRTVDEMAHAWMNVVYYTDDEMKAILDKIGYDGPASVEIFRPEYWEQDPFEVAVKSKAAAEKALGLGKYAAGGSW